MRLLLDTHIFLWYISADLNLAQAHKHAIQDPANDVYLSVASIWEAIIKYQLGKLPLPASPEEYLPVQRQLHKIESLAINEECLTHLAQLPPHHRDPFDRIIISQSLESGLILVSCDLVFSKYSVPLLPEV